jgi:hypothetical protein
MVEDKSMSRQEKFNNKNSSNNGEQPPGELQLASRRIQKERKNKGQGLVGRKLQQIKGDPWTLATSSS